jgi:molybdopterin molybdotransferase
MQLFVRPMIRTMLGAREIYCPSVKARLEKDFQTGTTGRKYLLGQLNEDNSSVNIFTEQEDFVSLALANCLVSVNEGDSLKAGDSLTSVILPRIK